MNNDIRLHILSMNFRKEYAITESSHICYKGLNQSGNWIFRGIVRYNNFGHEVERISAKKLLEMSPNELNSISWTYKNGKGKWHVMDIDHGTYRIWGECSSIHFA